MSAPKVSFVIPHKGREQFLCATLRSIAGQEGDIPREVIIITQNDELSADVRDAAGAITLRVQHADPRLTIAALRNIGAALSDAPYLAFLDADVALSPDWLAALLDLLDTRPDVRLVSAVQRCGPQPPPLEQLRTALSNAAVDAPVAFLPGRNLLLSRTTFEDAGRFPEHLVTCEDYVFTDRVAALGTLWYTSAASYVHLGEDKQLGEMFRKEIWRGQSNLLSLRGRQVSPGEWPSFLVPPWITVMLAVALVATALQSWIVAFAALGLGLAPFAAYVTRLYFLARRQVSLGHVAAFYGYYFPARAWGTVVGAFHGLGNDLHNQ